MVEPGFLRLYADIHHNNSNIYLIYYERNVTVLSVHNFGGKCESEVTCYLRLEGHIALCGQ